MTENSGKKVDTSKKTSQLLRYILSCVPILLLVLLIISDYQNSLVDRHYPFGTELGWAYLSPDHKLSDTLSFVCLVLLYLTIPWCIKLNYKQKSIISLLAIPFFVIVLSTNLNTPLSKLIYQFLNPHP